MSTPKPSGALLAICLAVAPRLALAEEAARQRPALELGEQISASNEILPPAALCARAELMLADGDPRHLLAARRLMEEAVRVYEDTACAPATLSRLYVAIWMRRVVEDDALPARALDLARAAVALDAASAPAHAALAAALLSDLQPEAAAAEAARALELDGDSIAALQTACLVRAARGDLEGARAAIDRALALRPDEGVTHHLSGNVHLLAGEAGAAVGAFRAAMILAPELTPARLQLASAFEESGNLRLAGALYKEILAQHPESAGPAYLAMARSLMKRSRWEAALKTLEKASFRTRRGLSDGTVLYYKAVCLEQMDRDADALKAYQDMAAAWPDATAGPVAAQRLIFRAWEGAARLHLKARDVERAAAALQAAVDRPDAPPDLFVSLASLYTDYKLPERGLRILEQGAAATSGAVPPRGAESLAALHVAWARLARQTGDAAAMARMADSLARRGGDLAARGDYVVDLSVVRAYAIAGRSEEALEWLRKAIAAGYTQLTWMKEDPDLAGLSKLPEFARLAAGLAPGQ